MAGVYVIRDDGGTDSMTRIRCVNEDIELQRILEKNPDLLPGDQIDPEDPRRWLLVKREMPVPDPNTGGERWSIDFVLVDQDAIPTFVECKRFADTRSRREVVGQMFEYAANGHYYWSKDQLREYAEAAANRNGHSLESALLNLRATNDETIDSFFDRVQQNLREGQLRIVFFLEESPMELRSVVDFLNKQMERSEVLLVEARQYSHNGMKIVVPTLFGYTEEARQVKRSVTVNSAASRRKWDKISYFTEVRSQLSDTEAKAIETLFEHSVSLGCEISWGTGSSRGSFSVKELSVCPRSLFSVYSNGDLTFNFGWVNGSETAERARDRLRDLIIQDVGLPVADNYLMKVTTFPSAAWIGKVALLNEAMRKLVSEFRAAPA